MNPYPLSILPAIMTFLPLTGVHNIRRLIPVARFNVPMLREKKDTVETAEDFQDSVARLAGYIASRETYHSLKPNLIDSIRKELDGGGDAEGRFRRIEKRSHRRWLGMEVPQDLDRTDSLASDPDNVTQRTKSGESSKPKSINSEQSRSSISLDSGQIQTAERGDAALDKVQLRKEVGAWWGRRASV
jgi:hypothetical protein